MAWCDVVEPRTLRECRIVLGQSQAAFAAMLGVSPEWYRTWDAGRRATPPHVMARARALATHRDEHALLPLPVLALLIGVHVKMLRAAARDGRLPVTYDTRTTFRRLRARAHADLLLVVVGPVVEVLVVCLRGDGSIDLPLPGDARLPPLAMQIRRIGAPLIVRLPENLPFLPGAAERRV